LESGKKALPGGSFGHLPVFDPAGRVPPRQNTREKVGFHGPRQSPTEPCRWLPNGWIGGFDDWFRVGGTLG